jgi:alkylation response protein AidB-like acyl-CoA dehydrogenase
LLDRPEAELQGSTDVCRKLTVLRLDDRRAERVGSTDDHTAAWRRVADDGAVALAAELVGTMEQAHHLAVEYAKERVQFGRPIATFQAIKHKAAEMLQRLTLARVGTEFAAWASDVDDPQRDTAAAMAKADAGEAAVYLTGECIQIHGGVGFTWDCDAHLHYRRAKANDLLLGGQSWHRARVAARALQPA